MAEGEHKDERSMMLTMRTDRVMAEALLDDDLFDAALAYVLFVAAEAKRAKSRMIELMDESGREVTIGDVRYYVGHRKSTTITSPTDLLDGLLEATQGDLGKLFDEHIMATRWCNLGAAKALLGDDAVEKVTTTAKVAELRTGKPKTKQLIAVNQRFTR